MATIDLGKIKFNWRNEYAGGQTYVPDDCVFYTDGSVTSSYICKTTSTGNAPSSGGTLHGSWDYLAKGQATSPTTTQGDIIVRGASADGRLAIGSAGQALKVNSSANGLEYGVAGGVVQVKSTTKKNGYSATSQNGTFTDITGLSVNITPTSTNNKILIFASVMVAVGGNYGGQGMRFAKTVGGVTTNDFAIGDVDGNRARHTIKAVGGGSNSRDYVTTQSMMHLDTPASTAAHTYKVQHGDNDNTNTIFINLNAVDSNHAGYGKYVSNITVFEIAQGVL
tara:strand:- start:83 stop:922 length:840 start_codon:yes stop_codon:yes gene_type:complete